MNTLDILRQAADAATRHPLGLPRLTPCCLHIGHTRLATADEVVHCLNGFGATDGWLTLASAHCRLPAWQGTADDRCGLPLAAELVRGAQSLHLRQGADGWDAWTYTETAPDDEATNSVPALVAPRRFVASDTQNGYLAYRVYWRWDASRGLLEWCARFDGFREGQ